LSIETRAIQGCIPTHMLVVQPATYCNLACTYCYLPTTNERRQMRLDTVAAIGRFLRDVKVAEDPLPVVWHAGEPLIAREDFYEAAFQILADTDGCPPLQHKIQTNATLINDRWCQLFSKWRVHIGVSIDGPADLHDAERRDRRGRGTHSRSLAGLRQLQRHGLSPAVIAVLTRRSLDHPDDMWAFLVDNGVRSVGFNVVEIEGANKTITLAGSEARKAYYDFLMRLLELRRSQPDVRVRELDEAEGFLRASSSHPVRSVENLPGGIISIGADGSISTFSPELLGSEHPRYGRFTWGNVHTHDWFEVQSQRSLVETERDIRKGIMRCRDECGYFTVCGGGAPSNKLAENGTFDSTKTRDCELRVMTVMDAILDHSGF
jgi:uncharacterized protein